MAHNVIDTINSGKSQDSEKNIMYVDSENYSDYANEYFYIPPKYSYGAFAKNIENIGNGYWKISVIFGIDFDTNAKSIKGQINDYDMYFGIEGEMIHADTDIIAIYNPIYGDATVDHIVEGEDEKLKEQEYIDGILGTYKLLEAIPEEELEIIYVYEFIGGIGNGDDPIDNPINEDINPKTGDNIEYYLLTTLISLLGIAFISKRTKYNN